MKSTYAFLIFMLFLSCSKEEQEKIDALAINPPTWIQGEWRPKDDTSGQVELKFTENSFIKIQEDGTEVNVMWSYILLQGLGFESDATVEEFKATNNYAIRVSTNRSDDWYRFTKISSLEMSWDNALVSGITDSVVYVKK